MNQKRYWLRGGIILVVLCLVAYAVLSSDFSSQCGVVECSIFRQIIIVIPRLILVPAFFLEMVDLPVPVVSIIYFLIGAFLGWLYGKIKNRNKV